MAAINAIYSTLLLTLGAALTASLISCSSPANNFNATSQSGDNTAIVIDNSIRPAADSARDRYRHPAETLAFFSSNHSTPWLRSAEAAGTAAFLRLIYRLTDAILRRTGQRIP